MKAVCRLEAMLRAIKEAVDRVQLLVDYPLTVRPARRQPMDRA